jgi:PadR family transcriptional regulator PadR
MPFGRGHGRRRRVMSFLQPCLLVLLHRDHAHGYSMMNELANFGFDPAFLDPSLVYRALREMEAAGLVVSEWSDESLGPQRRMYRVTPSGEAFLAQWAADLRHTRQQIDDLLVAYEAIARPEYDRSVET